MAALEPVLVLRRAIAEDTAGFGMDWYLALALGALALDWLVAGALPPHGVRKLAFVPLQTRRFRFQAENEPAGSGARAVTSDIIPRSFDPEEVASLKAGGKLDAGVRVQGYRLRGLLRVRARWEGDVLEISFHHFPRFLLPVLPYLGGLVAITLRRNDGGFGAVIFVSTFLAFPLLNRPELRDKADDFVPSLLHAAKPHAGARPLELDRTGKPGPVKAPYDSVGAQVKALNSRVGSALLGVVTGCVAAAFGVFSVGLAVVFSSSVAGLEWVFIGALVVLCAWLAAISFSAMLGSFYQVATARPARLWSFVGHGLVLVALAIQGYAAFAAPAALVRATMFGVPVALSAVYAFLRSKK